MYYHKNSKIEEEIEEQLCDHGRVVENNYNLICLECGEILEERNCISDNVRVYDNDDFNNKVNNSIVFDPLSEWRTTFDSREASSSMRKIYHRLNSKNKWTINRKSLRVTETKNIIINCVKFLEIDYTKNLSEAIEYTLRKTGDLNLQGKKIDLYAAAVLIYCIRSCLIPISIKKIFSFFEINKRNEIFKMINSMKQNYKLKTEGKIFPIDYIVFYVNRLLECKIPNNYNDIINTCYNISELFYTYRFTSCMLAGVLYYVMDYYSINVTQEQISEMLNVSSVSLRQRCNELKQMIHNT